MAVEIEVVSMAEVGEVGWWSGRCHCGWCCQVQPKSLPAGSHAGRPWYCALIVTVLYFCLLIGEIDVYTEFRHFSSLLIMCYGLL